MRSVHDLLWPSKQREIWWLWNDPALGSSLLHPSTYNVIQDDVAWLGECAWTAREDNAGIGLR